MNEYEDKFPPGLSDEEKTALEWKIEQDYQSSHLAAITYKDEYMTFAVNFYTRNPYSLEDIVLQHRAHSLAARRRNLAEAFLTDMKTRLRERELAHN